MSYLINKGVQISISSDDPGFFGYEGVTLDYVYATGAWSLDLRDLKKISLNSLEYSTLQESEKKELRKEFDQRWKEWVDYLNNVPE
jgi:adenosine deaminase CECR1